MRDRNAQGQPHPSSRSFMDGVVVFPDGSVMWTTDACEQVPEVTTDVLSVDSRSVEATSDEALFTIDRRYDVVYYQQPARNSIWERITCGCLGAAIAIGVLVPLVLYPAASCGQTEIGDRL
jgi:hypothetical protein